jgi:hypothetical protein
MNGTEIKFRSELHSLFALTVLNLLTVCLVIGAGGALIGTMLMEAFPTGDVFLAIVLASLGGVALACGVYWLVKSVGLARAVAGITRSYEGLPRGEAWSVGIMDIMIKMTALYRANRILFVRMRALSAVAGAILVIRGGLLIAFGLWSAAGFVAIGLGGLAGEAIVIVVGVAALLTARYLSIYMKVWDTRMAEAAKVEDVMRQKLEGA